MDSLGDHNPLVKQIRRAVARGVLTEDGWAVAEGPHLLEEALRAGCAIRTVLVSETAKPGILGDLSRLPGLHQVLHQVRFRQVSEKMFRTLCSTETPQGVLALVKPPAADLAAMLAVDAAALPPALLAILDGVQDPGNAGAIVRVAEAFGATGAIFLKGTVDPFHPRALRGSAGSSFRVPIVRGADPDALGGLKIYAAMARAGAPTIGTEVQAALDVKACVFTGACAIAIGSEGRGIGERLAGRAIPVHIPTRHVESLNAAVAAGILFYEAAQQRDTQQRDMQQRQAQAGDAKISGAR
jgi:TrmH family RNA methyltransferase